MEFQAVLEAVRSLSVEEQARLVDLIQDGLNDDPDLTPELMAELDRRIADAKANPKDGVPWEVVLAEARARHTR